jgi:TrmH family RNA methyltransferase
VAKGEGVVHKGPRQARIREISSAGNALVKVFRRALAEGVTRQGWLAVEGPLLLEEALKAAPGAEVRSVLAGQSAVVKFAELLEQVPKDAEVAQIADRLFERVAQTQGPQGIAALVEFSPPDLETILARRDALLLVACGIQDPGNLGTMLRSAEALGATALVTLEETVSPFNPKAVRASAGAIFRLPVCVNLEARALIQRLRAAQVRIVAADRRSPSSLAEADLRGPLAILIGREASGLPPAISREASLLLCIPIRPGMDSVNAATAASIFLYEAARQRGFRY